MDIQTAIDRMTEIESLTDEMDDDSASWILGWAIEKLKVELPTIADDDQAAAKIDDVIAVLKHLNGITALIENKKASALPARIEQFAGAYRQAFGQAQPVEALDPQRVAGEIAPKTSREAIEHLLRVVTPSTNVG